MDASVEGRRRLLRLQRRVHRSLEEQARALLGPEPASIARYEREFQRDFARLPDGLRAVPKSQLIERIRASEVTFVADFHSHAQSTRTALRLAREAVRPGEEWVLGLEAVESRHQRELDRFASGAISAALLRRRLKFDESWGFPWESTVPVLEWARGAGVRLLALDRPRALAMRAGARDLEERDRWAAGLLADLFIEERRGRAQLRALVLFGELHVASMHLPAELERVSREFLGRKLHTLIVHQNHDRLYWRLAREGKELRTQALRLGRDAYCVFSSTPWSRLHSLVSWAEDGGRHAAELRGESGGESRRESDEELELDSGPDLLALFRSYGQALGELLGVPPGDYDSLTVRGVGDADFVERLPASVSPRDARLVRFHVLNGIPLYLPAERIAYVGAAASNAVAELAAIHLLHSTRRRPGPLLADGLEGARARALDCALGFFGSLAINPRRKCDLEADHVRRLRELARGGRERFAGEALARKLALEGLAGKPGAGTRLALARPASAMAGARALGAGLAKRLQAALLAGRVGMDDAREIFFGRGAAEERFALLLRASAGSRLPPSKSDVL
jgi:hypothetical protein